jgi:hypothetical protein
VVKRSFGKGWIAFMVFLLVHVTHVPLISPHAGISRRQLQSRWRFGNATPPPGSCEVAQSLASFSARIRL